MILSRACWLALIAAVAGLAAPRSRAAEEPPRKTWFLANSPVAAASVLARLV
jgi:hypothetical protein